MFGTGAGAIRWTRGRGVGRSTVLFLPAWRQRALPVHCATLTVLTPPTASTVPFGDLVQSGQWSQKVSLLGFGIKKKKFFCLFLKKRQNITCTTSNIITETKASAEQLSRPGQERGLREPLHNT